MPFLSLGVGLVTKVAHIGFKCKYTLKNYTATTPVLKNRLSKNDCLSSNSVFLRLAELVFNKIDALVRQFFKNQKPARQAPHSAFSFLRCGLKECARSAPLSKVRNARARHPLEGWAGVEPPPALCLAVPFSDWQFFKLLSRD